jgi:Mg-chelatase subunit ChlD
MAALLLALPIVILHMLTPRRPPTPVSSLLHWDGLRHSITAAEPWQRLRWSALLILQLFAVALLAIALSDPARVEEATLAEHTVFVVDASGSMSAIDGAPDRLGEAVAKAEELHAELPQGGAASIVVASPNPAVLLDESSDPDAFLRALASVRASAGAADFEAAFALAESLVSAERPTGFVLLSDGGLDEVAQKLAPLGTRFEPLGESDTNRAITDLSVTAGPAGLQARVTIESTGGPDATQVLRLDVDGRTEERREVTIPSGQVVEESFELPLGEQVAAYLDGEDLLALDNQRFVAAPLPRSLKVRVHGESPFFIEELLAAIPDVDVDVAPDEEVDFEVYVGVAVPLQPSTPFIAVDTPGGAPGITPAGRVQDPIPTLVTDDPLLDDVDVSRIAIADAQLVTVESGDVLLAAPGAPLLVRGEADGVPFFYFAFTLEQSNLPVNVAFPIIGSRMVGELASAEGATESIIVGDEMPIGALGAEVTDPRGSTQMVAVGAPAPEADQAGFWLVARPDETPLMVAVNADTSESHLAPVGELPGLRPAQGTGKAEAGTAEVARSLLPWVVAILLLVLAVEYWVSHRARGVTSRQWRWGTAVRLGIVGLLALSLLDPVFRRSNDTVTTVFVVDVSDSVGGSVEESRAWVEAALTEAGDGQWAVVEFGADARLAAPVGNHPYAGTSVVDATATNLARGLRLGESLLSGQTRERLVLVSDGRGNAGDLSAELQRLESLGVVIDVHTIHPAAGTDAAVSSIDVPSEVNEGEAFQAEVEVLSTVSAPGEIELLVDGEPVATRSVDLEPGSNLFSFPVEAGAPGLQELTARVRVPGDATRQNDSTTSGVQVKGPASVLVLEGEAGNGQVIAEVLESKGLVVEVGDPAELPSLEELALHQAVVMVDVSARALEDDDVAVLQTYVKDLGRGMVVIGGDDSYALGSYQGTELEALLPVDSEAQDTMREANVAEVLLIDTSESMGACHCSEQNGQVMETIEGGVNKTDISKAAASRAVEVLGEDDEVGILAFSGGQKWVIPLQPLPSPATVSEGIGGLRPFGETRIVPALEEAANALRASEKDLKHIILFTDGFTPELDIEGFAAYGLEVGDLVESARLLAEEGITVSVVGTARAPSLSSRRWHRPATGASTRAVTSTRSPRSSSRRPGSPPDRSSTKVSTTRRSPRPLPR